jgi:hypothetical protein
VYFQPFSLAAECILLRSALSFSFLCQSSAMYDFVSSLLWRREEEGPLMLCEFAIVLVVRLPGREYTFFFYGVFSCCCCGPQLRHHPPSRRVGIARQPWCRQLVINVPPFFFLFYSLQLHTPSPFEVCETDIHHGVAVMGDGEHVCYCGTPQLTENLKRLTYSVCITCLCVCV